MKQTLIISFLLISLAFSSKAQFYLHDKFFINELGTSANYSQGDKNTINGFGFGVGIYKRVYKRSRVNVVYGVEFNQTNFKKNTVTIDEYSFKENIKYQLNYITVPVTARIHLGEINKASHAPKFFFDLGLFVDVTCGSKREGTLIVNSPEISDTLGFNEKYNSKVPNFGFNGGMGLKIPVKFKHIIIKSDYRLGFINQGRSNDIIYNNYVRLSMSYLF